MGMSQWPECHPWGETGSGPMGGNLVGLSKLDIRKRGNAVFCLSRFTIGDLLYEKLPRCATRVITQKEGEHVGGRPKHKETET